jgi:hypothetical protein
VCRKKARWWFRLGGRPVDHAASPRFVGRYSSITSSIRLTERHISKDNKQ